MTLNTVDNLETFLADIHKGHWDSVTSQVSSLKLPREKLVSATCLVLDQGRYSD